MITRFDLRVFHSGVLALSIGCLSTLAGFALEAPRPETEIASETHSIDRIAAVSVEGERTIAVEIHRRKPRPDWWPNSLFREDDSVVISIVDINDPDSVWQMEGIPSIVLLRQGDLIMLSVAAIHADSVVLMICDSMYGIHCTCIKQFFDAQAGTPLGHVEFEPLGESKLMEINNAIYAVTERRRFVENHADAIAARYFPGEPALVSGAERQAAIASLPESPSRNPYSYLGNSPILEGGLIDASVTPLTRPSCFHQVSSTPPLWVYILGIIY